MTTLELAGRSLGLFVTLVGALICLALAATSWLGGKHHDRR